MVVPVEIVSFALDPEKNTPLVILKECYGERTIPVSISPLDASAIAIESLEVTPVKPLTIDLVKLMMEALNGELQRVVVEDVKDDSYRTVAHVSHERGVSVVECAIADAVSLAQRCGVPVFVAERVFDKKRPSEQLSPTEELRQTITGADTLEFGSHFLE